MTRLSFHGILDLLALLLSSADLRSPLRSRRFTQLNAGPIKRTGFSHSQRTTAHHIIKVQTTTKAHATGIRATSVVGFTTASTVNAAKNVIIAHISNEYGRLYTTASASNPRPCDLLFRKPSTSSALSSLLRCCRTSNKPAMMDPMLVRTDR